MHFIEKFQMNDSHYLYIEGNLKELYFFSLIFSEMMHCSTYQSKHIFFFVFFFCFYADVLICASNDSMTLT